jgi:VanZ family protein
MYSILLVLTPFLLLRRFLQETIANFSRSSFPLGSIDIPIVLIIALVVLILLLILFRAHLTKLRILAGATALLLIAFAQQIADYYFGHHFYELQQNWHYIAYALFAFMMYRDLAPRGIPASGIMLRTFCCGLLFSTFDEGFQFFVSNRGFDMGDIAKDVWGTLVGMALLYLGENPSGALFLHWKPLRHPSLRGYFRHPSSVLILLAALSLLFLCFSSLLTDLANWGLIIVLTMTSFVACFLLFHISQFRWGKYSLVTILCVGFVVQAYFFVKHRSDYIVHNQFGLTVYKGIPIPFFDVMIFPNGMFRLVDKKHYFGTRDQNFFRRQKPDILLIGSGIHGNGGRGFAQEAVSQFIYNKMTDEGIQVVILKNADACRVFNRLKREGKRVLFVLHNTC